ncbi:MAG: hypothetical protein ABI452_06170 [Candidatus Limnocylindrales bacterium]
MQGVDVFCERCGTLQPKPEEAPRSAGVLARRMLDAVGITENRPTAAEDWLRLCLNCRGYSCPACWNESAGVCQTCEPMPEPVFVAEPIFVAEPEPVFVAEPEPEPVFVAEPEPEPVFVAEPEPVFVAEPEPEPVFVAEPEPLPVPAAQPDPVERPAYPRMPVLPLPPPRQAEIPVIPLPALPAYPLPPQIGFNAQASAGSSAATSAPAFEAHMLLAPPPELPAVVLANGLRPCGNCRLTLSARAHFCRRCGTQQPR